MSEKIFPVITRDNLVEIFAVVCLFREDEATATDTPKLKQTLVAHVLSLLVIGELLPPRRSESLQKNVEFAKIFEHKTRVATTTTTFCEMQREVKKNSGFLFLGHIQDRDFSQGNCRKKPEDMLCRTPLQLTTLGKKFAKDHELRVAKFITRTQWREFYANLLQIRIRSSAFAAKSRRFNKRVWGTELAP